MGTEPNRLPRIVDAVVEDSPAFVVLDAVDDAVACYFDRDRADFLLGVLGVVGSSGFCYPGPEGTGDPEVDAVRVVRLAFDGSGSAESRLETVDRILGGFGVEEVEAGTGEHLRRLSYVNAGDTYTATVALDDSGAFVVTSWGDFVEQAEAEAVEESAEEGEPVDRCGNCGEWGDASRRSTCCPSFHACEHCGKCSACAGEQADDPRDFDDVLDRDAWADVRDLDGSAVPFDDVRRDPPTFALDGRPDPVECVECRGNGSTLRRETCPTCRGAGEVVPWGDGFLAVDGLARLY